MNIGQVQYGTIQRLVMQMRFRVDDERFMGGVLIFLAELSRLAAGGWRLSRYFLFVWSQFIYGKMEEMTLLLMSCVFRPARINQS